MFTFKTQKTKLNETQQIALKTFSLKTQQIALKTFSLKTRQIKHSENTTNKHKHVKDT
jgi:hypothetical protein